MSFNFYFTLEFRVLNLRKKPEEAKPAKKTYHRPPLQHRYSFYGNQPNCLLSANFSYLLPRFKKMSVKQDWGNVWPGPRSFHPAVVPIPLRQGYVEPGAKRPSPNKFANAELMKIPNFLHLTPPVIKRQCEALKKFCTPWPEGLETDEKCDRHFPIEYMSSDYCHGLPTIRNPLSRIITLRVSKDLRRKLINNK